MRDVLGRPWLPNILLIILAILLVLQVDASSATELNPVRNQQLIEPEQQLAEMYVPIAYLKQQRRPCDPNGEPYRPAPVDIVFDDERVALMEYDPDGVARDRLVTRAPQESDLRPSTDLNYLDFPGNPRRPGCVYERHFRIRMRDLPPTTYARIVVDSERGELALQYWFFYYFNDWNNAHEGDWEMIQLVFEAVTVNEAIHEDPLFVGYAQHAGGELARWDDTKLQREGNHPIVYPAVGSHASHFESRVYLGWGENGTGFGCDDARGPSVRVALNPIVVPETVDPATSFVWLEFNGRWGERQPWEFNGARGPQQTFKWREPFEAMDTWRDASLAVPRSPLFGRSATGLFCEVTSIGANAFALGGLYPQVAIAGVITFVFVFVALTIRVRGMIAEIVTLYVRYWRVFLTIGVLTIPIGWAFNGLLFLLIRFWPLEWLLQWFNDTAGARLAIAAIIGGFEQVVIVLVVGPAVIQTVADIRAGSVPDVRRSYSAALQHLRPIASALILIALVVGSLTLFVVTVPLAILLAVRWQFFGQAVMLDGAKSGHAALRVSGRAMRDRWIRLIAASIVIQGLAILPGPVIGAILMLLGKTTVQFANGLSSMLYAVLLPIAEIALTLLYLQYADRHAASEAATKDTGLLARGRTVNARIC